VKLPYSGDDLGRALKEWIDEDIKESPRQHYDLGKFFFTVSIGTIGAVTAIKKGSSGLVISGSLAVFFFMMLCSLIVALLMVVPRERGLGPTVDLQAEHTRQIQWTVDASITWFVAWLMGIVAGGVALLE
jgi:hypothetical protein